MVNLAEKPGARLFIAFYISLMAICGELCLALILGLKAFSHLVYVVISFALLGYGLGSNAYLVLRKRLQGMAPDAVVGVSLFLVSLLTATASHLLPYLPIDLSMIYEWKTIFSLSAVYATVALPFTAIGFLIAYLFSTCVKETGRLYFWDLLGAGLGALVFFPLLSSFGPLHTLLLLSIVALIPAAAYLRVGTLARKGMTAAVVALALIESVAIRFPEPTYVIDRGIGWEWIPGYFRKDQYEEIWRTWHAMGRTDLHRLIGFKPSQLGNPGPTFTFDICVDPPPELCYFTNSYRAGTPVFALSKESLLKSGAKIKPFTQPIETPYVILNKPKVLIIGAGGGRDIFMAKVHQAPEIVAAEINPGTYSAMSPGGVAYEYSGCVYTAPGTTVHNIDGRHLVKTQPAGSQDLIILNGIDTFAALSTGAYAFAENYLYTQEAIVDYLRVLNENGVINFNRWFEGVNSPRETLRLLVMSLGALRSMGSSDPGKHIMVGTESGWGIMLVKRTPFTEAEENRVLQYFYDRHVELVYTPNFAKLPEHRNFLDEAVAAFRNGREEEFIRRYPADISPVHDDNPFFYKYYKFSLKNTLSLFHPAGGAIAFHVQALIVVQTVIFILIFIFLPLALLRRKGQTLLPSGVSIPFLVYFAALGVGFIFIEITLMQRFTLVLGSPLYSISVTLATILVATGIGSLLSGKFRQWAGSEVRMIQILALLVIGYLIALVCGGTPLLNAIVPAPFAARVCLSAALLAPLGIALGVFFPTGLLLVGNRSPNAVAWAWGINSGFTVLGSTVTIFIAQFLGFNVVLLIAAVLYLIAPLAYRWMSRSLAQAAA